MFKALLLVAPFAAFAQPSISIEEYKPKSTLVVPQHPVTRAKYPFIDVHNHQNSAMPVDQLDKLVKDMDSINLQVMVNLSGGDRRPPEKGAAKRNGAAQTTLAGGASVRFLTH